MLELRRTVDWEKLKTTIRFEDAGITICAEEGTKNISAHTNKERL